MRFSKLAAVAARRASRALSSSWPQVAVAVLDVHEREARARARAARPRRSRRSAGRARRRSAAARRRGKRRSSSGCAIGRERLGPLVRSGRAKRPECVSCRPTTRSSSASRRSARDAPSTSASRSRASAGCVSARRSPAGSGLARPSWRTATASPPQISFAPLDAEVLPAPTRQVARLAVAACRPSLPSAGCRSGCRRAPADVSSAAASGESAPAGPLVERQRGAERGDARRNAAAVLREATRG